ncbi:MAG: hypothetical protein GOP50_06615 [Candidatus Heimdallarchaeota archaeon]|nr:hypothetical protein [Candidatus Heimdallarchaeota archaeon]
MFGEQETPQPKNEEEEEEKLFRCSGCGTPLGRLDETCPHCERINPHYLLR